MSKSVRRGTSAATRTSGGAGAPRPEVIVDFVFDDGLLSVSVENIGEKPAHDVRVTFDKSFCGAGGQQPIPELRLFRSISFLAPRRRIATFVDDSSAYFARGEPTDITATVSYDASNGTPYEDTIRHDLEIYRDIAFSPRRAATTGGTGEGRD